jgi:hypothetical protein
MAVGILSWEELEHCARQDLLAQDEAAQGASVLMGALEDSQSMPTMDLVWDEYSVLEDWTEEAKAEDDLMISDHLSKGILVAKSLPRVVLELDLKDGLVRCSV